MKTRPYESSELTTDYTDFTDRNGLHHFPIREIRVIRGHLDLVAALPLWESRGQKRSFVANNSAPEFLNPH
jgi:hypothetical protein